MFKKKPQIKPAAPLRSSDRRKVADTLIRDYALLLTDTNGPPQSDEEKQAARTALRNSLVPDNIQTAKFTTTHGPQLEQVNGVLYIGTYHGDDVRILWWQIDGRMYPSIYTIWKHPDMVALLQTPRVVIDKMRGGADLMTPGIVGAPPFPARATKGAIVAISAYEQPSTPVAVGVCEIDVAALQRARGAKGMAVETLHCVGDELYNFSPADRAAIAVPDKIDGWEQCVSQQNTVDGMQRLDVDDDEHGGVPLGTAPDTPGIAPKQSAEDNDNDGNADSAHAMRQEDIDLAFKNAFLYGVHHHKTTNTTRTRYGLDFMLTPSFVMSTLIQPYLPVFTPEQARQLQIRKTSYKNLKKFIKALDKLGVIKSKDMAGHETVILDIDFEHPDLVAFKPYKLPKRESANGTSSTSDALNDGTDDVIGQRLEVKNLFRPTAQLSPLFLKTDQTHFSSADVKRYITEYVASESLVSEKNKRMVELNPVLANAVFDGSSALDKEVLAKGSIPRDVLIERVLKLMAPSYIILRNDADPASAKLRSGAAPKISVTLETRSGNKTVTKVSGLEAYYIRPKPLADELRKTCAGSTSVEPLAGATKKTEKPIEEIMIQGPQHDAVVKALEKRGVSSKWIDVVDKTKGAKGRKGH